jgi:hypothetical protein
MRSWLPATWSHSLSWLPNLAAVRIFFVPEYDVSHTGCHGFPPEPRSRDVRTGEALHRALVFAPRHDRFNDFLGIRFIQRIPSGQQSPIRFFHPALAILTRAVDPGRPAEVFTQQAPKSFAEAVELRSDDLVDFGR